MELSDPVAVQNAPWNKGKLVGQKPPLRLKEIWAIRIRLQLANRARELALFNLALDIDRGHVLSLVDIHAAVSVPHCPAGVFRRAAAARFQEGAQVMSATSALIPDEPPRR